MIDSPVGQMEEEARARDQSTRPATDQLREQIWEQIRGRVTHADQLKLVAACTTQAAMPRKIRQPVESGDHADVTGGAQTTNRVLLRPDAHGMAGPVIP